MLPLQDIIIATIGDEVEVLKINPQTLQVDPNGTTFTPKHVHLALRSLAEVSASLAHTLASLEPSLTNSPSR